MIEPLEEVLRRNRWVSRARWFARSIVGRDTFHRVQVRKPVTLIGRTTIASGGGCWGVWTGGLTPDSVVYSIGVGDDISFDIELIRRFGVTVHAFDPTPESQRWLAQQEVPAQFILHPLGVAAHDGTVSFFAPANPGWVSHSIFQVPHTSSVPVELPVRRLRTLMQSLRHEHIDLLKLDIEGSEYAVIEDLCASSVPVTQLLVEFHHRFAGIGPARTRDAIQRLNGRGLRIFYTSPNGEEYGFVRA